MIWAMEFKSFDEVVKYMERFVNLEKRNTLYNSQTYRLDRMKALLETLGNPQNSFKSIHVAGSKGKGSTSSFIAALLTQEGYKTGLYMSPHVSDYRERFTLSGKFFEDEILCKTGNKLREKTDNFTFNGTNPTTFEMYTAFAFLLFQGTGCEYAVIETGLGGRLDATNVISPIASVLTPVELEHTDLLGNSIKEIATEKSKIIKKNTLSFISYQKEEALEVFKKEALEQNSKQYCLEDIVKEIKTKQTPLFQEVEITYKDSYKIKLNLKMLGLVQAQNCALAIAVVRQLDLFNKDKAVKALENTTLPGRMERINCKNTFYLDGAHTPQSMENLLKTFREIYPDKQGICIFGSVEGKNHEKMAEQILENFNTIVISRPGTFKQSNCEKLYDLFLAKKKTQSVLLRKEARQAVEYIFNNSDSDSPVLVCGSFYLVGVIKEALNEFKTK